MRPVIAILDEAGPEANQLFIEMCDVRSLQVSRKTSQCSSKSDKWNHVERFTFDNIFHGLVDSIHGFKEVAQLLHGVRLELNTWFNLR